MDNAVAVGMLLSCISAAFYASLPVLHQRWSHLPSSTRALGQFGFALLFFLLFLPKTRWDLASRDWAGLLFLAIGVTLIAHSLWVRVTTRLSPAVTAVIYYGNIPIAVLLGVVVLHEPLTMRTVAGGVLIVGGSLLGLGFRASAESRRRPPSR
jgi:drug/metabolite transporter (DMT)-like permease